VEITNVNIETIVSSHVISTERDDIRRGHMIGDAIDRHRDSEEERGRFEESWQRREEAELRPYYEDDTF
jgi:hypothetical protein